MKRPTFKACGRLLALTVLASGLVVTLPQTAGAATRKPRVKLQKPQVEISEAFYDKAWRTYQIGSKKEKGEVIRSLRSIVRKSPEEFMAHYYLGIMTAEDGSPTQALRHFETALVGFPKSADIHVRMATLLDANKKSNEAVEHYQKALELEPGNARALSRLGIFELENSNLDRAYDMLTRARQLQPDNPETLRGLGSILVDREAPRDALPILEQALLFDQKHAETHWLIARAYEKLNQPEKASEHFAMARKLGRRDPEMKELIGYDLARSLAKEGKNKEAEAEYKKEIGKNADPATGHYELAQFYYDTGREDASIDSYVQAYKANKALGDGVLKASDIYLHREDYKKAEEMLNLLKSDPVFKDKAKTGLAELKEMREKQEKLRLEAEMADRKMNDSGVEANFLQMLDLNSEDASAIDGLIEFYKERGYFEKALYWFKKYDKIRPTSDFNRKLIEKDLKNRNDLDNFTLFGRKLVTQDFKGRKTLDNSPLCSTSHTDKYSDKTHTFWLKSLPLKESVIDDDNLMNLAFNGENDRLKELAFLILLVRPEYKKDRKLMEGLLEFYSERGRVDDAVKMVNSLKSLGYYTASEATEKRAKLREK
ncbi:MAG: tetratricopeptide repeat protein [Candidatus Riflebacteria bacterium]|nr:tetratricopeptide repeat protein [Candidatus Riflebacteria bacterium]